MKIYERLAEIDTTLEAQTAKEVYEQKEAELIKLVGDYSLGAEMSCPGSGFGHVVAYRGNTFDNLIVDIEFASGTKSFALSHILTYGMFVKLEDTMELKQIWYEAALIHTTLTNNFNTIKRQQAEEARAAAKQAEAEKKAEEKYQSTKAKALKEFEEQVNTVRPKNKTEEFYYSLGWLAKHVGVVTAKLPDYLGSSFEKHFGLEAPKTLVDGKAKTSGGYAKQWSWEFVASVKKIKDTVVPAYLQTVATDISKGIHNTSFVWDLVANYGFQFGKTQDFDKIRACVPAEYLEVFESGYNG